MASKHIIVDFEHLEGSFIAKQGLKRTLYGFETDWAVVDPFEGRTNAVRGPF